GLLQSTITVASGPRSKQIDEHQELALPLAGILTHRSGFYALLWLPSLGIRACILVIWYEGPVSMWRSIDCFRWEHCPSPEFKKKENKLFLKVATGKKSKLTGMQEGGGATSGVLEGKRCQVVVCMRSRAAKGREQAGRRQEGEELEPPRGRPDPRRRGSIAEKEKGRGPP
ncbi:hypothetical protein GOP47_0009935, partial [Adiantum capillus-veneris]